MKVKIVFILFNVFIVRYIYSQNESFKTSVEKGKKQSYFGIAVGFQYNYMNSNFNWEKAYNNYCGKCKVGYNYIKNGTENLIDLENYEDKDLIRERNIPSYINNGIYLGINFMHKIFKKYNFYYESNINFKDHGKFYYSERIIKDINFYIRDVNNYHNYEGPYTYIPLIYNVAYLKTIGLNQKIYYNLKIIKNISIMPFLGLDYARIIHSEIKVYEFENNKYVGILNPKYYNNKVYKSEFKNVFFNNVKSLNYGISVNYNLDNKLLIGFSYSFFEQSKNKNLLNVLLKNDYNYYQLLHNKKFNDSFNNINIGIVKLIELRVLYKI